VCFLGSDRSALLIGAYRTRHRDLESSHPLVVFRVAHQPKYLSVFGIFHAIFEEARRGDLPLSIQPDSKAVSAVTEESAPIRETLGCSHGSSLYADVGRQHRLGRTVNAVFPKLITAVRHNRKRNFHDLAVTALEPSCRIGNLHAQDLYVSSYGTNEVLRYDGTTGEFIDAYVTAESGSLLIRTI
jgi:hypothetical protein